MRELFNKIKASVLGKTEGENNIVPLEIGDYMKQAEAKAALAYQNSGWWKQEVSAEMVCPQTGELMQKEEIKGGNENEYKETWVTSAGSECTRTTRVVNNQVQQISYERQPKGLKAGVAGKLTIDGENTNLERIDKPICQVPESTKELEEILRGFEAELRKMPDEDGDDQLDQVFGGLTDMTAFQNYDGEASRNGSKIIFEEEGLIVDSKPWKKGFWKRKIEFEMCPISGCEQLLEIAIEHEDLEGKREQWNSFIFLNSDGTKLTGESYQELENKRLDMGKKSRTMSSGQDKKVFFSCN